MLTTAILQTRHKETKLNIVSMRGISDNNNVLFYTKITFTEVPQITILQQVPVKEYCHFLPNKCCPQCPLRLAAPLPEKQNRHGQGLHMNYTVGIRCIQPPGIFPLTSIVNKSCNIKCRVNNMLQIIQNMTFS